MDTNIEQFATAERWTTVWQTIKWGDKKHRDRVMTTRKALHPPEIREKIPYLNEVAEMARKGELRLCISLGVVFETQATKIMPWLDNPFTGIPVENLPSPWTIVLSASGVSGWPDYDGDRRFNQLKRGLSAEDAFNVRCAEEGHVDYFLTLDERLTRAIEGWRNLDLPFPVLRPSELLQCVRREKAN